MVKARFFSMDENIANPWLNTAFLRKTRRKLRYGPLLKLTVSKG
jgi:hypothetical protein